jgi:hypothetical protein
MDTLFANGTYRGRGRWIDQKAEGGYTAQYMVTDGPAASKIHDVHRVFLKADGSVAYEEKTSILFERGSRSALWVTIHGAQGTVAGPGYVFDRECHYDIDVTAENHLEFTFHAEDNQLHGLGSATNNGNRTYWRETLERE